MNASTPLPFISDERLLECLRLVLDPLTKQHQAAEHDIYSNVVDPFSAILDSAVQNISAQKWIEQEKSRQLQKTLQNAVGAFHQNILGSFPGWDNLGIGQGFDLKNDSLKVIAEIKNKYNTQNSKSQAATYRNLQNSLGYNYKGYTAYAVFIVPKSPVPVNAPFAPNDDGRKMAVAEDIRKIDGASFYDMASGEKDTLERVYARIVYLLGTMRPDFAVDPMFAEFFRRAYKSA